MVVITPYKQVLRPETLKNCPDWSVKPNFSKIALVTGLFHKIGMVEFNFSSNQ
jgi:hypothetical protein